VADARAHGRVDGAFEEERLLGVAVWLPPGAYPWGALRKLRALPHMLRVALAAPGSFLALGRLGARVEEAFPVEAAPRYLEVVGVDGDARGRGVGTQLLEPALRRADAEQSHCYLETDAERNVAWYRRLGFRVERSGLQLAGPEGPGYWTMTRPPQPVDST
jgi:GNAT superfamily N-acetyltransferase